MTDIAVVLLGIIILFTIFLIVRSVFSLKVCALCGSISLTWITLLILFYLNYVIDPVFIGILMGGSIVGSIYLLEQKLPEKYHIFKLPYYLTLVFITYFLLTKTLTIEIISILFLLWLIMILIYTGGRIERLKNVGRKIIKCCKNW